MAESMYDEDPIGYPGPPIVDGECAQIMWTDRGTERCGQDTPCPDHDRWDDDE